MFRRPRNFQPNPLNPDQMALLVKANQLVAQGKPRQAAPLYARVAQAMQASRHPRRAANLYTRASHAFADGDDASQALATARLALTLFTQVNMPVRLATFYTNITHKMSSHGMDVAAAALQKEFGSQVTALPTKPLAMPPPRRPLLPTNCPKCGAPVRADDLTWVDDNTVECDFCGSLIRSES